MRRSSSLPTFLSLSIAFILCCASASLAQTRDKFVISAKAGGINAVTGDASVYAKGESDGQQLMITDDLNAGDRVRTAYDGRVEILLNPGSYLRVGGNSEIELSDNTLANLEVRLIRGTAIVEAAGASGIELNINISTPHTKIAIVRQGLYRLSVVPGDATELIVRKGRVVLGDDSHTKVKGGNKVVFSATNISVAKLTKEEKKKAEAQDVDVWSKERAETLARANRRITNSMLTSAFASFNNPFFGQSGYGFWFFNGAIRCYTFVPFYYGFTSPYGSHYSTSLYYGISPLPHQQASRPGVTWPTTGRETTSANGTTTSGGGNGSSGGAGSSGGSRPSMPSPAPSAPMGNDGGMRQPRMIDPDTGNRMPRKNIEPIRPNN
jgi:hypothetical protein